MVTGRNGRGSLAKGLLAFVALVPMTLLAVGAFPAGVAVGWRVASGGWWWPSTIGAVPVWRILAGVVAGGLVFRVGLVLRVQMMVAWREVRDESGGSSG